MAQVIQFFWAGLLGIVFVYMLEKTSSQGCLGKAIIFGILAGFFIYAIPVLFKIPHISQLPFNTVVDNHFGGLLWAFALSYFVKRFEHARE